MSAHVEYRVALPGGVELSVAERGDPAGPPVVFLHGYTDSWLSYEPLMARLPDRLRLIAVSQRGHGDSDKPEGPYGLSTFAGDLAALFDRLRIEEAVVVGHSMGSLVAQRFALDHPRRARALVLIGAFATAKGNPGAQALWDEAVDLLEDPVPREVARAFQESTFARPAAPAFLDLVVSESLKVPARVWRAALDALLTEDFSAELGRIAAPTLILWGDKDTFCDKQQQELLTRSIAEARLIPMLDVGHAPHWELPRRVADILAAFIDTLEPAAPPVGAG